MFTSRPLAEMQAEQAASAATAPNPTRRPYEGARVATPVPVLDMHFEDLPNEEYAEFNFDLKTTPGVIYTLGIEDDAILFEVMDVAQEGSPNEIIDFFFRSTFRRAVHEDGTPIEHGLRYFLNATSQEKAPGERESRRYLMSVVTTAIDRWTEELTDTSMRPMNRAQRRSRRR